ncbi:MAG: SUMF1/EgtB/PvdO family nonheme iron enzyme [Candidatus Firestonebacteria bacterium]
MLCPNCKTENRDIAKFCKNCQTELIVTKVIEGIKKAEDIIGRIKEFKLDDDELQQLEKAKKYFARAETFAAAKNYEGAIEWIKETLSIVETKKDLPEDVKPKETIYKKALIEKTKGEKKIKKAFFIKNIISLLTIVLTVFIGWYLYTNTTAYKSKIAIGGMIYIPAGEFEMGSNDYDSEKPVHKVYLDAYYIDKYEVTNEQFKKFVDATGHKTEAEKAGGGFVWEKDGGWKQRSSASWKDPLGDGSGISGKMNHPVIQVSWNDAVAYANWIGKRLPTEAEWEKACRAGSTGKYCFGDNESELGEYTWYYKNSGSKTHQVGSKKPNKWGIYDMHGNVWEWCSDWYNEKYYKVVTGLQPVNNPKGPDTGTYKVLRGGSLYFGAYGCRSANRYYYSSPVYRYFNVGFRCVLGGAK